MRYERGRRDAILAMPSAVIIEPGDSMETIRRKLIDSMGGPSRPRRTLDDWNDLPKKPINRTETPQGTNRTVKPNTDVAKPTKPVEKPKKAVPKTTTGTKPTEKPKKAAPKQRTRQFEVRAGGTVYASFSSKSKADAMKKELKSKGLDAKVVAVYL